MEANFNNNNNNSNNNNDIKHSKWPIFSHQGKNFKRGQSSLIGFLLANILLNLFYKTNWR